MGNTWLLSALRLFIDFGIYSLTRLIVIVTFMTKLNVINDKKNAVNHILTFSWKGDIKQTECILAYLMNINGMQSVVYFKNNNCVKNHS